MRIPIFWRLTLGYSLILLLSVAVSSYSIVQLGRLSGIARAALDTDNRMIAYEEKLTDAFLSEVRYAGRFLITHAASLHDQFRQFRHDFDRYMNEIKSLAASAEIKTRLSGIEELHLRYQALFDQEVRYVKAGQPYAESRFQLEKEKILESGLGELDRLKRQLQQNLHDKLENMEREAAATRTSAIAITLLLVGLGLALSLAISKGITGPLARLKVTAVEETEQDSGSSSEFYRIPEIQELSDALSTTQRRLRRRAEVNNAFVHTITEQFVIPLVSLKKRLTYLEAEFTEKATAEQKTTFDVLVQEIERLIQRSAELQGLPAEQIENPSGHEGTVLRPVEGSLSPTTASWKRGWDGLLTPIKTTAGRVISWVAGLWHATSHSNRTVDSGKARKQ
jgi:methyl-accepting chemotaxis protein